MAHIAGPPVRANNNGAFSDAQFSIKFEELTQAIQRDPSDPERWLVRAQVCLDRYDELAVADSYRAYLLFRQVYPWLTDPAHASRQPTESFPRMREAYKLETEIFTVLVTSLLAVHDVEAAQDIYKGEEYQAKLTLYQGRARGRDTPMGCRWTLRPESKQYLTNHFLRTSTITSAISGMVSLDGATRPPPRLVRRTYPWAPELISNRNMLRVHSELRAQHLELRNIRNKGYGVVAKKDIVEGTEFFRGDLITAAIDRSTPKQLPYNALCISQGDPEHFVFERHVMRPIDILDRAGKLTDLAFDSWILWTLYWKLGTNAIDVHLADHDAGNGPGAEHDAEAGDGEAEDDLEAEDDSELDNSFDSNNGVIPARIGVGTAFSMFNHDCKPNADWVPGTDPKKVVFRANRNIDKNEEITISYLCDEQLKDDVDGRRNIIKSWGFTCTCDRCIRELEDDGDFGT